MLKHAYGRPSLLLTLLGLLLLVVACAPAGSVSAPQPTPLGPRSNPVPLGPPEPPRSLAPSEPLALMILHTNDTAGEIDPCG